MGTVGPPFKPLQIGCLRINMVAAVEARPFRHLSSEECSPLARHMSGGGTGPPVGSGDKSWCLAQLWTCRQGCAGN